MFTCNNRSRDASPQQMWTRAFGVIAIAALSFLWGCGGTNQPSCVCKGQLPSGESLNLSCGEMACIAGVGGVTCAAANQLEPAASACPPTMTSCVPSCTGRDC